MDQAHNLSKQRFFARIRYFTYICITIENIIQMTGLYVVQLNGIIYGIYSSDDRAKRCQAHVSEQENKTPEIRYLIVDKDYWEQPDSTKFNPLYNFNEDE